MQPTQNLYFLLPLNKPQASADLSPLIRTISQFLSFLEERWWTLAQLFPLTATAGLYLMFFFVIFNKNMHFPLHAIFTFYFDFSFV